ncbi:transporter substrate-binding and LysM peptidoglycan-binding domain-containing protein [Burkholderia gladioli]|uniref:transporter substrate-binding and LysM peptidoglycan-binding domain-containing protein n=1 Tax=Burkholderia gladioli TaxID=28095 RepID=UPI001FC8CC15|nr:transporter substrate-binding domain-containing protein [Burkholderia gladioli]
MPELTPVAKFGGLVLIAGALVGGYVAWKHGVFGSPAAPAVSTMDIGSQSAPLTPQPTSPAPLAQTAATPPAANPVGFQPSRNTLQSIISNGLVRVSVENPSEPFYGEASGVPHGFNVEFANLLFSRPEFSRQKQVVVDTRHEVNQYADVPAQLLKTDSAGNPVVDVAMDGLTFPDNTPSGVVYSVPYVDDFGYALIVQKGSPIHSASDLSGRTIGILKGDPDVRAFVSSHYPGARLVEVDDADPHFIDKSVDGHAVDAFIYDYPFAVDSVKGTDLTFAVSKLDGSNIAYKIGVRAQDQELLIYLNSAIAQVKQSPAYLDLLRKYFISNQVVTTAAHAGEKTYVVRRGDTLNMIAASTLGNGQYYRLIQTRNNLPNPNLILVGQRLVIPVPGN